MSDTTEIAGTLAGLKALDEETIATLQARLAECEREKNHFSMAYLCAVSATQIMTDSRDALRAQLTETRKMLEVQLAVGGQAGGGG